MAIELKKFFLYPGAIFCSEVPHEVLTVLGSCVSVCLFDKSKKVGGINHYMLPLWNGRGLAAPKYGNISMEKLIKEMLNKGCKKKDIVAKVFGGGEVIKTNISMFNIGERNIELAYDYLKKEGISVAGASVGGSRGRKIVFNTSDGSILHKFVQKSM